MVFEFFKNALSSLDGILCSTVPRIADYSRFPSFSSETDSIGTAHIRIDCYSRFRPKWSNMEEQYFRPFSNYGTILLRPEFWIVNLKGLVKIMLNNEVLLIASM